MSIFTLIQNRRAIRRYRPDSIPKAQIEQLLEAACWAPSAHNRQPWRFAVITHSKDKVRLAKAMGHRLRTDRMADGDPAELIEKDIARSYTRITSAPTLIIVCLSLVDMDTYPDSQRNQHEWVMAVQSVSMAAQNLWLAATEQGLSMCWLCAPLFVPALVQRTINLPADWEPLGLMTLGYAAEEKTKTRAPLHHKLIWIE